MTRGRRDSKGDRSQRQSVTETRDNAQNSARVNSDGWDFVASVSISTQSDSLGAGGPPALTITNSGRNAAPAGVWGARPPLDSKPSVKRSSNRENDGGFRQSNETDERKTHGRSRLATPVALSAPRYRAAIADELRGLRRSYLADRVASCGRFAQVWDCSSCGETNARAIVSLSCGSRACPDCSRELTNERVTRALRAVVRVPAYVEARRAATLEQLAQLEAEAEQARDFWDRMSGRARSPSSLARIVSRHDKAEARRKRYAWQRRHASAGRWAWRLVTLSPQWRPHDPRELSVDRLRVRREKALEAFGRVWEQIETGGLASAQVSVECSDAGHVHVHALVYSGWLSVKLLRRLAGCFVDVREVQARPVDVERYGAEGAVARALREAVKYAIKAPGPRRQSWQAGARFRVAHPGLVARWTIANERAQLGRVRGVLRDAFEASEAEASSSSSSSAPHCCPVCKAPLSGEGRRVSTRDLARALTPWEWRARVEWRRLLPATALGPVRTGGAAGPAQGATNDSLEDFHWRSETAEYRRDVAQHGRRPRFQAPVK